MTKGWKLESARHSLARKGIETGRKIKARWEKFKEHREFKKSPYGKLADIIEKAYKLGFTDKEVDDYILGIKRAVDDDMIDIAVYYYKNPKEFLEGSRAAEEREQTFKKMEKQKEKFDKAKEKIEKEKGRKPTTAEEDELLAKIMEEG